MKVLMTWFLSFMVSGAGAMGQLDTKPKCIAYRIEIDGHRVGEKLRVVFLVDGREVEAQSNEVSFQVPAETESAREVRVRLQFGAYDLEFPEVFASQLDGTWIVGIDKRPFEKSNLSLVKEKPSNVDFIYFIKFYPTEGAGTGVISYEKRRPAE